jgi:hypothetical protein
MSLDAWAAQPLDFGFRTRYAASDARHRAV